MSECSYCVKPYTECECGKHYDNHGMAEAIEKLAPTAFTEKARDFWLGKTLPDLEVRAVDSETGGMKGRKPQRLSLLPYDVLAVVSEHYTKGADKYGDRNFEKGYPYSWAEDALLRHFAAWHQGEDLDAETGSNHLDAVIFHALTLRMFQLRGIGTDDRPNGA